jgi:hypothetical protein
VEKSALCPGGQPPVGTSGALLFLPPQADNEVRSKGVSGCMEGCSHHAEASVHVVLANMMHHTSGVTFHHTICTPNSHDNGPGYTTITLELEVVMIRAPPSSFAGVSSTAKDLCQDLHRDHSAPCYLLLMMTYFRLFSQGLISPTIKLVDQAGTRWKMRSRRGMAPGM